MKCPNCIDDHDFKMTCDEGAVKIFIMRLKQENADLKDQLEDRHESHDKLWKENAELKEELKAKDQQIFYLRTGAYKDGVIEQHTNVTAKYQKENFKLRAQLQECREFLVRFNVYDRRTNEPPFFDMQDDALALKEKMGWK